MSNGKLPDTTGSASLSRGPRLVALGDVSPDASPEALSRDVVDDAIEGARESTAGAAMDLLAGVQPADTDRIMAAIETLMAGASPDDAAALRKALLRRTDLSGRMQPGPDDELADNWRSGAYPYRHLMLRKNYEQQKYRLQVELLKLQAWVKDTGQKVVILFEGRDAAGKGGAIKRFMEHLNPRGARVAALEKPSDVERGQWFFQRYAKNLPTAGEIVLFDRSWYNRAGVERVMGFCTDEEYLEFMRQCPEFERMLVRNGTHLIKFWFSVSRQEQRRRSASGKCIHSSSGS